MHGGLAPISATTGNVKSRRLVRANSQKEALIKRSPPIFMAVRESSSA